MRKAIITAVVLLSVISVFPIIISAIDKAQIQSKESSEKSQEESSKSTEDEEEIILYALKLCDENFCDEGLKCVLSIARNNLSLEGQSKESSTESNPQDNIEKTLYKRLKALLGQSDARLSYKSEAVYIPVSSLSSGKTGTGEKYPYMKSVASPWDCLAQDFVYGKNYNPGVSLYGLNYLCQNGASFKEALKWYLPEFSVE